MTVRESRSLNALGMALPPKLCHRAFHDIDVDQGNHAVRRTGTLLEPVAVPLSIFHFPLRNYRQFERKIAAGGAAYERNAELNQHGGVWRMLYEKLKRGELESYYKSQELSDSAIEQGVSEHRLVYDDRLRSFLQRHGISATAGGKT